MKSIVNFLYESQNERLSFQDIQRAKYSSSFMGDRSLLGIDGQEYYKIGKNKWELHSSQSHVISNSISDKEMYDKYLSALADGVEIKKDLA